MYAGGPERGGPGIRYGLPVTAPGDSSEQEADRIANLVIRRSALSQTAMPLVVVQAPFEHDFTHVSLEIACGLPEARRQDGGVDTVIGDSLPSETARRVSDETLGSLSNSGDGSTIRVQAYARPTLMRQSRGPQRRRPRRSVDELIALARRPMFSLRVWPRLNESERAALVGHVKRMYGIDFGERFRREADGRRGHIRGDVDFHPRAPLPGELEALQAAGYRFAGYQPGETQVWVCPTGEEVWFLIPYRTPQPPPLPSPPASEERECEGICVDHTQNKDECFRCCDLTVPEPRTGNDRECYQDCVTTCFTTWDEPPPGPGSDGY
jgi:hypothetical protein